MTELLIWAIAGGILNRFSGWTDYLPGRNIYYAALVALAITWSVYGPIWGLLVFISFLAYRLPGWQTSLDMGTYGETLARDFRVMTTRGLYFAPVFIWAAFQGSPWALAYLALAAFGASICYVIGNHVLAKIMRDPFWFIEFGAGACFGAACGLVVGG